MSSNNSSRGAPPLPRRRPCAGAAAALASCLCFAVPASTANAATLEVRIGYHRGFDAACSVLRGYPIEAEWRSELEASLPAVRALWSSEGRPVLERMFELSGRRLHGRRDVRLTLCDLPSSSLVGTTVNMRHALRSFTPDPVPLRYKIGIANHELLHGLLAGADLSGSRLLAAHAGEPERVRRHLHLFALMKAALLDLGREDALEEMQRFDARLPEPAYRRAWQLVNSSPNGHLAYVQELRPAR